MFLAERGSQITNLSELLDAAKRREGSVTVVTGAVGAGKSGLLRVFAERAGTAGASVLTATCSEWEHNHPWGVLQQLLGNIQRVDGKPVAIAQLLGAGLATASWSEIDSAAVQQVSTQVMQWLWTAERPAQDRPTVIVVDDVQHADRPSLQFLLQFARKIISESGMLVLSAPEGHGPDSDFMRLPHYSRLWLPLLTEAGVASMLGTSPDDQAVRTTYELSGGNPFLVRALAADQATAPGSGEFPTDTAAGTEFARAVLTCLHRSGDKAPAVARGLAVLGTSSTPAMMAQLLGGDATIVPSMQRVLGNAGLLAGTSFRHESVRSLVINAMDAAERSRLYLDAAELLHTAGASAVSVAERLVQAGKTPAAWMIDVLRDAAGDALGADRVDFALSCLRLARSAAPAGITLLRITVLQMMAESRLNAATTTRHLPEVVAGLRAGQLTGRELVVAVQSLLRHGQDDEASDALGQLTSAERTALRDWLAITHPEQAGHITSSADEEVHALSTVLTRPDKAIGHAEKVLESSRLTDVTVESKAAAVLTLIYADQLDKASSWCARLLDETEDRRAPSWQAMFTAIDAEIVLRKGALPQAERSASTALSLMPPTGWGVGIGMPLSSLLLATTAMGTMDLALDCLGQPVPEAMFRTRFGVQYLYARGRYFLVTHRQHAALDDFMKCGALLTEWDLDIPAMVPWRTAAAMAHQAMGDHERAYELVVEQLERPGGHHSRTKGVSLRLLAATSEPGRRLTLLQESTELLRASGDRLELALTLAELSRAQRAVGETNRARVTARFAAKVAEACGAAPLPADARLVDHRTDPQPEPEDANGIDVLSDAERRVAILAARGETNQEIARRLFITVSTVEQHLTKVYRKLGVSGRADLPGELVS